ncbi:MAG: hypothetical protein BGO00_07425 [Alphaproteobacteria bacterium 62-8]|nr:MAG: hypothetical protein BGO00_07425 [Alphaproteobacteria bacterium 62-8]
MTVGKLEMVSAVEKNSHVEFRVGFTQIKQRRMARLWQRQYLKDDTGMPGINIPIHKLGEVITHLIGLCNEAAERGYLEKEEVEPYEQT